MCFLIYVSYQVAAPRKHLICPPLTMEATQIIKITNYYLGEVVYISLFMASENHYYNQKQINFDAPLFLDC